MENQIQHLSVEEFYRLIQKGEGILLDVRTKQEFDQEHIEGAGNLNYYAMNFRRKLQLLPKDTEIYLYCNVGARSASAANILRKMGYPRIYNLAKGIMAWNLEGFPVIRNESSVKDETNKYGISEYRQAIAADSLVLVDFYAPWCMPCQQMMPTIDQLQEQYKGELKVIKVNADVSKRLVKHLRIMGVPLLIFLKNGEEVCQKRGLVSPTELIGVIEKYK